MVGQAERFAHSLGGEGLDKVAAHRARSCGRRLHAVPGKSADDSSAASTWRDSLELAEHADNDASCGMRQTIFSLTLRTSSTNLWTATTADPFVLDAVHTDSWDDTFRVVDGVDDEKEEDRASNHQRLFDAAANFFLWWVGGVFVVGAKEGWGPRRGGGQGVGARRGGARSTSANFDFGQLFFFFRLRPISTFCQFRLRPISTSAIFWIFGTTKGGAQKGASPEGWRPRRVEAQTSEKWGPEGWGPKGGRPEISRFFSLSRHIFLSLFSLSWGVLSLIFGGV